MERKCGKKKLEIRQYSRKHSLRHFLRKELHAHLPSLAQLILTSYSTAAVSIRLLLLAKPPLVYLLLVSRCTEFVKNQLKQAGFITEIAFGHFEYVPL